MTALPITEREFQRQVTDLAEIFGWLHVHFRPAQTSHGWRTPVSGPLGQGWPDLILVNPLRQRVVFAELKAAGRKTSADQEYVLGVLRVAGLETYTWHPEDIEQIAEVLR